MRVCLTKVYLLVVWLSESRGSLSSSAFLPGIGFLLTFNLISKAWDLADRLGFSFVVLLNLFTDFDFFSSFFVGIFGSIPMSTALILLAALS